VSMSNKECECNNTIIIVFTAQKSKLCAHNASNIYMGNMTIYALCLVARPLPPGPVSLPLQLSQINLSVSTCVKHLYNQSH